MRVLFNRLYKSYRKKPFCSKLCYSKIKRHVNSPCPTLIIALETRNPRCLPCSSDHMIKGAEMPENLVSWHLDSPTPDCLSSAVRSIAIVVRAFYLIRCPSARRGKRAKPGRRSHPWPTLLLPLAVACVSHWMLSRPHVRAEGAKSKNERQADRSPLPRSLPPPLPGAGQG